MLLLITFVHQQRRLLIVPILQSGYNSTVSGGGVGGGRSSSSGGTIVSEIHDIVLGLNQSDELLEINRRFVRVQSQLVKDLLGQWLCYFHRDARPVKDLLQFHSASQLIAVGVQLGAESNPNLVQALR